MPAETDATATDPLLLHPIGMLRTPFRTLRDCPRNPRQIVPAPQCEAEILPEFAAGLHSLGGFSHLILLYWLHQGRAPELRFTPPFDTEPRGVFRDPCAVAAEPYRARGGRLRRVRGA